jgi:hypothetical protein
MHVAMGVPDMVGALVQKYGSLNAASRETKIPLGTLWRLQDPEEDPRLRTLESLAVALDMTLPQALVKYRVGTRGNGNSKPHA